MERQLDIEYSPMPHYDLLLVHNLTLVRDVIELALGVEWEFYMKVDGAASLEHMFGMGHAHFLRLGHSSLSVFNLWIDVQFHFFSVVCDDCIN